MNDPYPLLTYSFVEYLTHPDRNLSDKTLLEIGSGSSSIFWASYFKNVYSYEDDHENIQALNDEYEIPDNVEIFQAAPLFKKHICSCDYIIIDNNPKIISRESYAREIVSHAKEGCQIILDNGTWNIGAYKFLRDEFFCRDFPGTNRENDITVTSLFFKKISDKYM